VTKFLQTLLDGVTVGSLYALIALGYTMVYGILQFINFAHSDIFMLGAWFSYLLARVAGWASPDVQAPIWSYVVVLLGAMAICGTIGFTIERLAYRPLRDAPRLNVLITAIGVSLFLENTGQLRSFFGTQPQRMPDLVPTTTLFTISGVDFHLVDLLVIAVALVLMFLLQSLVFGVKIPGVGTFQPKIGRAMRAVSFDHRIAALMGIPVDFIISFTFVVGSALAGGAGLLYALKYPGLNQPAHSTWILLGLKAFVAAVIGGIGNLQGAMLGGLLIGLIELFGAAYLSPQLRDVYVFTLLIVVLLLKPTGILGKAMIEKV
jgi:branched-chain amino acid transport system permease protein